VSGFQNSAARVDLRTSAARSYSLIRPPRIGWRLICCWSGVRAGMIGAWREKSPRPVWSPTVAMGAVLGKYGPQVPLTEDQDGSASSVLAVSTSRSAKQFARGHRGGRSGGGATARPWPEWPGGDRAASWAARRISAANKARSASSRGASGWFCGDSDLVARPGNNGSSRAVLSVDQTVSIKHTALPNQLC
jgi:hypothetical protein